MAAAPEGGAGPVRWLIAIGAAVAALLVFALVAPRVPLDDPRAIAAAGVLGFVCVGIEVLAAAATTPARGPRWLLGVLPALAALAAVATAGDAMPRLVAAVAVTAALLVAGTILGGVVGAAIDEAGHLIIVAVLSALVDVFSVLHPSGPTHHLVRVEAAVSILLLPWPILGTARIEPILGFGDVCFAAIYVTAARRHGLSIRRTIVALAAGLLATLGVVLVTGVGVPALPFLGAAVVIAHPEARRLPARDRKMALIGLGIAAALFAAIFALR